MSKWKKVLGNTKPEHTYKPQKMLLTRVKTLYKDMQLNRVMKTGEKVLMPEARAKQCAEAGFVDIMEV